jgi:ATP-binding cassette subfamily F protein 3
MDELNQQLQEIDAKLADPALYQDDNSDEMTRLMQDKAYLAKDVGVLEEQWMEASEEYEEAKG